MYEAVDIDIQVRTLLLAGYTIDYVPMVRIPLLDGFYKYESVDDMYNKLGINEARVEALPCSHCGSTSLAYSMSVGNTSISCSCGIRMEFSPNSLVDTIKDNGRKLNTMNRIWNRRVR